MATHSSTLAWQIPWMEKPGGLPSMGSRRVRHDWAASISRFTFMHWRRKWQPIPVFLPGEPQGRWSLVGCRLWGYTESDTTEVTQQQQQKFITTANSGWGYKLVSWEEQENHFEDQKGFVCGPLSSQPVTQVLWPNRATGFALQRISSACLDSVLKHC